MLQQHEQITIIASVSIGRRKKKLQLEFELFI